MWISGSTAFKFYFPEYQREVRDLDVFITREELDSLETIPSLRVSHKYFSLDKTIEYTIIDEEPYLRELVNLSGNNTYISPIALYIEKKSHISTHSKEKWTRDIEYLETQIDTKKIEEEYAWLITLWKEYNQRIIKENILSKIYTQELFPRELLQYKEKKSITFLLEMPLLDEESIKEIYKKISYIYNQVSQKEQKKINSEFDSFTRILKEKYYENN